MKSARCVMIKMRDIFILYFYLVAIIFFYLLIFIYFNVNFFEMRAQIIPWTCYVVFRAL